MGPKRRPRTKRFHLSRSTATSAAAAAAAADIPAAPTPSPPPAASRDWRPSAAERIHGNRGYPRSVKELLRRHPRLQDFEPSEATRDVFKFTRGQRSGSLIQTHLRFRFDYPHLQRHLLTVFDRLFALQGSRKDAFEVVITFNAILHCQDTGTYSVFFGTDFRENNRLGAAQELGFGGTFQVRSVADVTEQVPVRFDMQDLLHRHRNAFPNSNVSVFKILSIIYLIYQCRD